MSESEKKLIRNVQTHDLAESLRLRRAVQAQEAGLPPEAFSLPFPASVTIHQHKEVPDKGGTGGWVRALVTAMALVLGTGGGAGLTAWLLRQPAEPPAPVQLRVRWWVEDGQLKHRVEPAP
jgi:hypothetical protein